MDASLEEREAILLRYRKQNPDAPPGAHPTPEEEERLLFEIRERAKAIEGDALKMLTRGTRNAPTYSGMRSKHMYFFFVYVLMPILVIGVLAQIVGWIVFSR